MQPVADYLGDALGKPVKLVTDYVQNNVTVAPGEVVLLENVRFNAGEKKNDAALSERYAALCDVFVMDAFGTAHRAEASTEGVIAKAKTACAGPLLAAELDALAKALITQPSPCLRLLVARKFLPN